MESLLKSTSLVQRAYWLIRLRWVAIAALAVATFGASEFMGVSLPASALYTIAAVCWSTISSCMSCCGTGRETAKTPSEARIGGILTFQISADLFILATILHFSGGIENPFSVLLRVSHDHREHPAVEAAELPAGDAGGGPLRRAGRARRRSGGSRTTAWKVSPATGCIATARTSSARCSCSPSRCTSSCT